jgi:hypothetical protein
MKKHCIAALLVLISLPVLAGDVADPVIEDQAHALDQPIHLTLSNFFTEGWDQGWAEQVTPGGAPDIELLHGDTNFLERVIRTDYYSEEETPGDRSIRYLDGLIAYSFNRRFMLEVTSNYEWKENHDSSASSGGGGSLEGRFQLVDVPGASYAFKFSASEPNHGIGSKQTGLSPGLSGWNDLTGAGLNRVGVYCSIDESTFTGPAKAGTRRNEFNYTVALAKTWTDPERPLFGNFTTFAELYGETVLDGKTRDTTLDVTPGIQFDVGRGNVLMAGVDLPLTYPHGFNATYRLTYIMNFDGKGSPAGENQLTAAQSNNWANWHLPYWHFSLTEGWESQYMFRGEDLTPGAGGFFTSDLEASTPGFGKGQTFTAGVLGGLQMGEADYAGVPPTIDATPEVGPDLSRLLHRDKYFQEGIWTHQKSYRELDLTAKYKLDLGSILVGEVGDILYFSEYEARTDQYLMAPRGYHFVATGTKYTSNGYSRKADGEDRNDIYLSLSTNPSWCEHVIPKLTYHETFDERKSYDAFFEERANSDYIVGRFQRINAPDYGGYLEGRVDGDMSLIKKNGSDVLSLRPYVLLSVSFNDETEATANFGRKYFTGWNDTEIGVEAPLRVDSHISISGLLACAHRFTTPDESTVRNEVWGGAKVTMTF